MRGSLLGVLEESHQSPQGLLNVFPLGNPGGIPLGFPLGIHLGIHVVIPTGIPKGNPSRSPWRNTIRIPIRNAFQRFFPKTLFFENFLLESLKKFFEKQWILEKTLKCAHADSFQGLF